MTYNVVSDTQMHWVLFNWPILPEVLKVRLDYSKFSRSPTANHWELLHLNFYRLEALPIVHQHHKKKKYM